MSHSNKPDLCIKCGAADAMASDMLYCEMCNPETVETIPYEIVRHGIESPDYFQGCGTVRFEHCATGIGSTEREALADCLEFIAVGAADDTALDSMIVKIENEETKNMRSDVCQSENMFFHVSIRYGVRS